VTTHQRTTRFVETSFAGALLAIQSSLDTAARHRERAGPGLKCMGAQDFLHRHQSMRHCCWANTMRRRVLRAVEIWASLVHEVEHSFWIAPANSSRRT
jgi:hypothetical protein